MSKMTDSLYHIRLLDDLARGNSSVHRLHPLAKLLVTLVYLVMVVSFGRYEVAAILPFVFFPIFIAAIAEIPAKPILNRLLLASPLILGIGILNPIFDRGTAVVGGISFSSGWLTFLSIAVKGALTVTAGLLLIATTGMDRLAAALRMLKVPKIFVLQLLLTYRYISVLIEEGSRMTQAYMLRAPGQKGIRPGVWGSFAGNLLLRTYDRAQRVYDSMILRGFSGEYRTGGIPKIRPEDIAFVTGWSLFFILVRIYNIPALLGSLLTGV